MEAIALPDNKSSLAVFGLFPLALFLLSHHVLASEARSPIPGTPAVAFSQPNSDTIAASFQRRPLAAPDGEDFTIIAMPDTQHYTDGVGSAATFSAQTQWIVANKDALNIVFVTGLGDIVQNGNANDAEWQIADAAYSLIEDESATLVTDGIPYGLSVGNHDQTPIGGGDTASTARYNQYFGETRYFGRDYYGGHYGADNDNNFQLFTAGGMDFIIIHFEYDTSPLQAVLDWADALLTTYSNRRAIVSTHHMINIGNPASWGAQGQAIYNALSDHENLFLMLGGHVHGEGRRQDVGANGNVINTLLSDYQDYANGGNGFLRVMTFSPGNNTISVMTYSPSLGEFEVDGSSEFSLTYDMGGFSPVSQSRVRVNQSSDDAEERNSDGAIDLTSTDLEMVHDNDDGDNVDQLLGMRFQNVEVPAGATILNAYIEFATDETSTEATSVTIRGEAADNPGTFTASTTNISSRTLTTTSADWSPGAWGTVGAKHRTSDISVVVQELVYRNSWASGNAMAFMVSGSGRRVAESYDGEPFNAPLLVVDFVTDGAASFRKFKQGVNGFTSTVDTYLAPAAPTADNSAAVTLVVDRNPEAHIMLRFDTIFGDGAMQIPLGSTIQSAQLTINVSNASAQGAQLHRMLQSWNDSDNWDTWGSGIQANSVEAANIANSSSTGSAVGLASVNVTADLQLWSNGAANHGWAWLPPAGDDSWQFDSAESGVPPELTVIYVAPVIVIDEMVFTDGFE